jgi:hypothetical protein
MTKRIELLETYAKNIQSLVKELSTELQGKLWMLDHGVDPDNVIYYASSDTFCVGWRTPLEPEEADAVEKLNPPFTVATKRRDLRIPRPGYVKVLKTNYYVRFKGGGHFEYDLCVPKGTRVSHMTASGVDYDYNFAVVGDWVPRLPDGSRNGMLMHDLRHHGINVPVEYLEEVKS